jgi:hypothetical protein
LYALIIQGPIYSNGKSYDGVVNNFNSVNTIINNIKSFTENFKGDIVLSTYVGQINTELNEFLSKTSVRIIENPFYNLNEYTYQIKPVKKYSTNKKKQYSTTFNAIKSLKKKYQYIIKIRTDVEYDFRSIKESLNLKKNQLIFISYLVKPISFINLYSLFVPDFIFVGKHQFMYKLFNKLEKSEMSSWVHLDYTLAIIYSISGLDLNFSRLEKKIYIYRNSNLLHAFKTLYFLKKIIVIFIFSLTRKKISLLTKECELNQKWRGNKNTIIKLNKHMEFGRKR